MEQKYRLKSCLNHHNDLTLNFIDLHCYLCGLYHFQSERCPRFRLSSDLHKLTCRFVWLTVTKESCRCTLHLEPVWLLSLPPRLLRYRLYFVLSKVGGRSYYLPFIAFKEAD